MGAKESKPSCISYEIAIKRVSESELHRLKDAFKKSAGVGRLYLSRKAFQQDVLCEGVPNSVTDLLYSACGGTSKGISFKDLLCGLVLLTRGTEEEKTRFLWNLYCNDGGTYIVKSDYVKAVNLSSIDSVSLFAHNDRVNFEKFQEWILNYKSATILSKWLLSDACISLTSELETPTFYQSLAGVTHLEEKDIGDLEKEFWRLKNTSPNGQLDLQYLGPLISPPIPKNALIGLFNAFDENRDGHIDFKELCCGVSAACRGPGVERTRFCFKIFDVDSDGVLNHDECMQMINVLLFVAKENRNANLFKDLTTQDAVNDLMIFVARKNVQTLTDNTINDEVSRQNDPDVQQTFMGTENVSLAVEDFMMWSMESNYKLVQPFLDLTFEVCHIVFGLWPQCKHMEYDIVRGWLKREQQRKYRVGQFWYLISHDWWLSWIHYTQGSCTPCEYCRKSPTIQRNSNVGAIDEALVCDESFNSNSMDSVGDMNNAVDNCSLGSASSGVSTGRNYGLRPGPIDNTNLIIPNQYKNVRNLTGEGGNLRRDTSLVQNHDFELVPKSLWKALNRWYGDNVPLPRQVIQPTNSSDMELEMYPLSLRILLHQNNSNVSNLNSWGAVSGGYGVMASGGGYAAITSSSVLQPPKRYLAYTAAFTRLATVRQVGEFLCDQLRLRIEDVRLWHISSGSLDNGAVLLEEDNMSLQELQIRDNEQLLLEIRNKDLTWPEELGSLSLTQGTTTTSGICGDRRMTRSSIMSVHVPGATGLHNLGNTCFMNAALQVLFNTQPLAEYFHRNVHQYELNTANRLGTGGQLATRYGELLKEVWTASTRSVAPLKLRFCVTKNAPQFAGGGQHDSQELLEWFLDALHEDLNRVMDKPYSELKDSNGRPDKIVAAEAWAQHHARNQSIIIDLFYGQLKSKVSCLGCGRESVRFDPFSLLSLPLPVENYVYFEVLVILLDGSVPIKFGLRLNSESKYIDLKHKLSVLCSLNPNFMLICEIWNSQIRQILMDNQKIKPSTAKELYVYQLPEECTDRSRSSSTIGVNIEKGLKDIQRSSALTIGQDSLISFTTFNAGASQAPSQNDHIYQNQSTLSLVDNDDDDTNHHQQAGPNTDEDCVADDDDDDNHVSTKQSHGMARSPENSFVQSTHKRVASIKLLNATNATVRSSNKRPTNGDHHHPLESCSDNGNIVSSSEITVRMDSFSMHDTSIIRNEATDCQCRLNSTESSDGCGNNGNHEDSVPKNWSEHPTNYTSSSRNNSNNYNNTDNKSSEELNFKIGDDSKNINSFSNIDGSQQTLRVGKYLFAVHRKITRHDSYFLSYHKTRPSLFGVPLLIPNCEGETCKDWYCAVWQQVRRLLSPLPASTEQANHAADCDDSLGYDFPFTLRAVKRDGLTCALCPWSNFCRGCEIPCSNEYLQQGSWQNITTNNCNTTAGKMGIQFSSLPNLETKMNRTEGPVSCVGDLETGCLESFTIAIDWDPTALHLRYQSTLERLWTDHETVAINRKEQTEPVDLNHCLEAFTSEEKLEQWYHCSHCKGKKPATKKLQIWKLPPILIVHLKRFNCVNGKWVKSQKVVHFPFDNFDPTPYLASVPQETILRHKELLELNHIEVIQQTTEDTTTTTNFSYNKRTAREANSLHRSSDNGGTGGAIEPLDDNIARNNPNHGSNVLDDCHSVMRGTMSAIVENEPIEKKFDIIKCDIAGLNAISPNDLDCPTTTVDGDTDTTTDTNTCRRRMEKRKRLISTSLTKTPIIDGEFEDYHQHIVKSGEDKFDPKYKLYAVVSHSGMLNGGHYISYASNQNGTWYCYNDSSCREITAQQPNIDPSSAYLLFYERRGLDYEPYLPSVQGMTLPNATASTLDIEDSDNDLKKLCSIS